MPAALSLLAVFTNVSWCAEKSVIIGLQSSSQTASDTETVTAPTAGVGLAVQPVEQLPLVLPPDCHITRRFNLIPAVVARVPEEAIQQLRDNPAIAYVEENWLYESAATDSSLELDNSWHVRRIDAAAAHAAGVLGTGIRVAVLDTGIDYTHEDLDGNYLGGYDFVFSDNDPMDDSTLSHGTHVAGIIAAERNGIGVVGVAPEAGLYGVKVLDGAGFGLEEWIIAGIEWAVSHNVDIINMSLTGPDRQALRDACDTARDAGVLLVAAAGNSPGRWWKCEVSRRVQFCDCRHRYRRPGSARLLRTGRQ